MFMSAMTLMRLTRAAGHARRQLQHLVQRAVGADSDAQPVVLRLDVDVGRTVAHGLLEDHVDDLDDRRVLVDFDDDGLGRLGELLASCLGARFEVEQCAVDLFVRGVDMVERPLDLVLGSHDERDRSLERFDQARLECLHEWICARDVHPLAFDRERDRPQLERDRGG